MGVLIYTDECPSGACQMNFQVTEDMCHLSGRMTLGAMARQMQRITEIHFDQYAGLTGEELRAKGFSWVIAWTNIEMIRFPKVGEQVILRVWPGKNRVNMYSRYYALYTMSGELLMSTSSLFLLMDQKTRTVAVQPEEMNNITPLFIDGQLNSPKLNQKFPTMFKNQIKREVVSDEIDYNGHLNNSRYLDWTEELLDEEFYDEMMPKSVWVQYIKELREGDIVKIQYVWEEDTMYLRGTHKSENSFLLKMMF